MRSFGGISSPRRGVYLPRIQGTCVTTVDMADYIGRCSSSIPCIGRGTFAIHNENYFRHRWHRGSGRVSFGKRNSDGITLLWCRTASQQAETEQVGHEPGDNPMISVESCQKLTPLHADNVFLNPETPEVRCVADLERLLHTHAGRGISSRHGMRIDDRKRIYGKNEIEPAVSLSFLELVMESAGEFTVLVLMGAGAASLVLELWLAANESREPNLIESVSILVAVAVVVLVSAGNNWQKDRQFRELQEVQSRETVRAIREAEEVNVLVEDVVVGDVLLLETGDILCADGILVQGFNVSVDESHLTGESDEVKKDPCTRQAMYSGSKLVSGVGRMIVTAVGSRSQAGAIADMVSGKKRLSVLGSEESMVTRSRKEETLLQKRLSRYASEIGKFGVGAALITFGILSAKYTYQHFLVDGLPWDIRCLESYLKHFITGVTILVVAIPEGLPLAVTISLAYSVMKMLEDNNLVRHLSAAETMGTATVICTDKTGTLTQNKMVVTKLWLGGETLLIKPTSSGMIVETEPLASDDESSSGSTDEIMESFDPVIGQLLCDGISLNSTANVYIDQYGNTQQSGNRTEVALLKLLEEVRCLSSCSIDKKVCQHDAYDAMVVGQRPFTSERKRMSSVVLMKSKSNPSDIRARLYVKGAAEVVLGKCDTVINVHGKVMKLSEKDKSDILSELHGNGLRLLCLAYKDLGTLRPEDVPNCEFGTNIILYEPEDIEQLEQHLTAFAVTGISDPLRPEVIDAIRNCHRGGISVRMFTGDNAITAESIAKSCGILSDHDKPQLAVMESRAFLDKVQNSSTESIDEEKFVKYWKDMRVLARCSPADKYSIVEALKKYTDEIVAVTGDGTNDAPALRAANVGFAMNDGTQIAKEAADIILVDNNFASTVSAALWGRNVYANIARFLQFQLTVNLVAVITAAGGAIASTESPLTTVQMLWVNLIMDSLASLALATGSPDPALLDEEPYSKNHNFVDSKGPLPKHILGQATFQLAVMAWMLGPGPDIMGIERHVPGAGASIHHTMVFNTFVMMQLFNQLNARQIKDTGSIWDNIDDAVLFKWVVSGEFLLQICIVQFGGTAFATVPLSLSQWGTCIGFGGVSLLIREGIRRIRAASWGTQ